MPGRPSLHRLSVHVGSASTPEDQLAVLSATIAQVAVQSDDGAVVLVLAGQPIDEPVVGHGPFVMNSAAQTRQAIEDYRLGRFGRLQQLLAESIEMA